MKLSELTVAIKKAVGKKITVYKWWINADIDTPFPHAVIAKVGSGDGLYADNTSYFGSAMCEMYLAMLNDDRQEEIETLMDDALNSLEISYSYRIGYNRDEDIIVKIYEFEIPEN